MLTHWESSKKPLFIKMVWKNGQHHALLRKEESIESLKFNASNFNQKNIRMVKSAVSKTPTNLNISSVKLLQSARQSSRQSNSSCQLSSSPKICRTPVSYRENLIKSNMLKKKTTNKKFVERQSKQNSIKKDDDNIDLVITPTSLEINNTNPSKTETSNTISRLNLSMDIPNNSLSERVMVWLDLATQDENCNKTLKKVASMEKKSRILSRHKKSFSCSFDINHLCTVNRGQFYIEGINLNVQLPKSILKNGEIEDENDMNMIEDTVLSDTFYKDRLVSSKSEENVNVDINEDILSRKIFMKRQLHVFIPNLGKKISDCDNSLLGSSLSGISITRRYI